MKEWGTTYFTFEEDPEPYGRVRDQNIIAMCKVRLVRLVRLVGWIVLISV